LTGELWFACELWYFQFAIRISAWASWPIFWDIGLTSVSEFNLSLSIERDIPVEDILIRIKYRPLSWRSQTETETGMMVNSLPSVAENQIFRIWDHSHRLS
jgi:hypothetical protein